MSEKAVTTAAADWPVVLTGALAAEKVFALRLVGVDGCHCHVIVSVRIQILQYVAGLLIAQDGLEGDPKVE